MVLRCVRMVSASIVVLSVLGAAVVDAGAADGAGSRGTFAVYPQATRMRLGVDPPAYHPRLVTPAAAFPLPRTARSHRTCRSWRAMTDRLGETFIAARLRHTILLSACPAEPGTAVEARWLWPWDVQGLAGHLPPRRIADHGAWSIRCDDVGPRQRCALAQTGVLTASGPDADPGAAAGELRFSAHFVIDAIGAEERIVWRLFVHHRNDALSHIINWNTPRGSVAVRSGSTVIATQFSLCSRDGCLLELDLRHSAEIIDRLWDGHAVTLDVTTPTAAGAVDRADVWTGTVAASGLRRALPQLTLLRQRELQPARDAASRSDIKPSIPMETGR